MSENAEQALEQTGQTEVPTAMKEKQIELKEKIPAKTLSETVFDITGDYSNWPYDLPIDKTIEYPSAEEEERIRQGKREEIQEIEKRIEEGLQELFPQTITLISDIRNFHNLFYDRQRDELRIKLESRMERLPEEQKSEFNFFFSPKDQANKLIRNNNDYFRWGDKRRAPQLYQIASFLQQKPLNKETAFQELKEAIGRKKILVLGDDVGSFSEVLNKLGAEAYGIERDGRAVAIAHSGIVAEDMRPQTQVIEGQLLDLRDGNSDLYKGIKEKGPFDVIFSRAVFNSGSGFPEAFTRLAQKENCDENILWQEWFTGMEGLLSKEGFHLHTDVDITPYRPIQRFVWKMGVSLKNGTDQEKEMVNRNIAVLQDKVSAKLGIDSGRWFFLKAGLIPYINEQTGEGK